MISGEVTDEALSKIMAKILRCVQNKISRIAANTISRVDVRVEDGLTVTDYDALEQADDEDLLVKEQILAPSTKKKERMFEILLATKHPIGICSVKLTWKFDDKEDLK